MTAKLISKGLGTRLREVLPSFDPNWKTDVQAGRLVYIVNGETMTPGEAAERFLGETNIWSQTFS